MTDNKYALIWFEGDGENCFTLVDKDKRTVLLSEDEAKHFSYKILSTESDVENTVDGTKYAIAPELLENLFGWDT